MLGIDTSASAASAAVCELGDKPKVIACGSVNTDLTHSQTLLPFVKSLLDNSKLSLSDIDRFAVSSGPGSFTGLRIGISAVKGMAYAQAKPCRAVSTLLGLAYNFLSYEGIVCAVMDARCSQVYNALFEIKNGEVTRLCEDRALFISELEAELKEKYPGERIMLCGDGADLCYGKTGGGNILLSPAALKFQSGTGVCFASEKSGDINAAALMPTYLRLPQAERERLKRLEKNNEN